MSLHRITETRDHLISFIMDEFDMDEEEAEDWLEDRDEMRAIQQESHQEYLNELN